MQTRYSTLISTDDAYRSLRDPRCLIFDCRYYLDKPLQGREEYLQAHMAGAIYADLATDLSAPVVPGVSGRHPLPDVDEFCQRLSQWGVDESAQVIVYDQGPGMIAARLWWMLRWLGHDNVAVMDGGWRKWCEENKPVVQAASAVSTWRFNPSQRSEWVADAADVAAVMGDPRFKVLDARAADRFAGENETLDPVAGHIPGALSAPFANNLDAAGCMLAPQALRAMYAGLLGDVPAEKTIVYCGSGVTAAHNILAMEHAGLGMARLYAGSWSHWITDRNRLVARGK